MQKQGLCLCQRDVMSICTATGQSEQEKCRFYKKASFSDRCMYFMFGEYCDCLEAQMETQQEVQADYIWI
mgnify:FL=1